MSNKKIIFTLGLIMGALALTPELAAADVMGSLSAVKGALSRIFPIVGMMGLLFAGLSFFTGNPNANTHLKLALLGAAVGFGAEPIIMFVDSLIN